MGAPRVALALLLVAASLAAADKRRTCSVSRRRCDRAGADSFAHAEDAAEGPVRLLVTPRALDFGKVPVGVPSTQIARVRNVDRAPVQLLRMAINSDDFKPLRFNAEVIQPGEQTTIGVSVVIATCSRGDAREAWLTWLPPGLGCRSHRGVAGRVSGADNRAVDREAPVAQHGRHGRCYGSFAGGGRGRAAGVRGWPERPWAR